MKDGHFAGDEYQKIFNVIAGKTEGKYYLLVGEYGTGTTQLVLTIKIMDLLIIMVYFLKIIRMLKFRQD